MSIQPAPSGTGKPARKPSKRILPPHPMRAAFVIVGFVAVLYLVELVNASFFAGSLDNYGIVPRQAAGLPGVVWAPLLHETWQHLFSNTVAVAVFGFLAMASGIGPWIASTVTIWLISGLGVWLIAPAGTITVGASGIAFGWLAFLLVRGIFNRSAGQILVALVLLFFWGSILFGLLPGQPHISWQAHLFGAIGGILAAWLSTRANRTKSTPPITTQLPGNLAA
ncbi:MAG: rhomboid family intramembrane serine protease [Sciscionella sp.]